MAKKNPKKKITIAIDIDKLKEPKIPKNMQIWSKDKPMGEKCKKMIADLSTVIIYVSDQLNEGPEVKGSIIKRCLILKSLTQLLLTNTFLDNFHRFGIIQQIQSDMMARQRPILMVAKKKSPSSDGGYVA